MLIAWLGLLVGVAWLSCRLAGIPNRQHAVTALIVTALALWAEPVSTTLPYGQITLVLLVLVPSEFAGPVPSKYRDVLLGIAVVAALVDGGTAGFGPASLFGVDRVDVGDLDGEVIDAAALAAFLHERSASAAARRRRRLRSRA